MLEFKAKGDIMNKKLIPIVAGTIVLALGAGAYFMLTKDDSESDSDQTTNAQTTDQSDNPLFSARSLADTSYVATMNSTSGDGNLTAIIRSDGRGNLHYSGSYEGGTSDFYSVDGQTIVCTDDECFASAALQPPVDESQYDYTEEDVASWREKAVYKGKQACPAGTCDTWEVSEVDGNGTIYIDGNGRISRATWNTSEGSMTIDYSYEPVTITAPENVQTLPELPTSLGT